MPIVLCFLSPKRLCRDCTEYDGVGEAEMHQMAIAGVVLRLLRFGSKRTHHKGLPLIPQHTVRRVQTGSLRDCEEFSHTQGQGVTCDWNRHDRGQFHAHRTQTAALSNAVILITRRYVTVRIVNKQYQQFEFDVVSPYASLFFVFS